MDFQGVDENGIRAIVHQELRKLQHPAFKQWPESWTPSVGERVWIKPSPVRVYVEGEIVGTRGSEYLVKPTGGDQHVRGVPVDRLELMHPAHQRRTQP